MGIEVGESAAGRKTTRAGTRRRASTPEELAADDRRRALELMRKRAVDDLSLATVAAHQHMLQQAIAALDAQLAKLLMEIAESVFQKIASHAD